jgi:hypothetical protein
VLILNPLFSGVPKTEITGLGPSGEVIYLIPLRVIEIPERAELHKITLFRANSGHVVSLRSEMSDKMSS